MDYMHLPLLNSLKPLNVRFRQVAGGTLLSALAPLVLGSAIAPAIALLPVQPVQAQQNDPFIIQRSLRLGDRGADVLQLQRVLAQKGFLNFNIPRNAREGYFGPATQEALRGFQRSEPDLRTDGVLGETTFRRLFSVGLTPTRAYSIALMQAQLSELGYYNSRLDGEFGPITERALLDLQDEAFVQLDARPERLEDTFGVVSGYYDQQRRGQDLPHSDVLESRVERQLPQSKLFGFNGFGSGGFSNNDRSVAIAPASTRSSRNNANVYRAIVPLNRGNDAAELSSLRTFLGSLQVSEDGRGRYAQAGAYGDRRNAEEMVAYLRSKGFDARVIFD